MALFRRKMNRGMQKTRDNFSGNLDNVLGSFESIDDVNVCPLYFLCCCC